MTSNPWRLDLTNEPEPPSKNAADESRLHRPERTPSGRPSPVSSLTGKPAQGKPAQGKPFLGIRFECCRTYCRIYPNEQGSAYEGRCPKCRAAVRVPIGSGGVSSRFFSAG